MNYVPMRQMNTVRQIARNARQTIRNKTGMKVDVMVLHPENEMKKPEKMLQVIATALGMTPESYRVKSRARDLCELRFLGAMFLRTHFPRVTLYQIAGMFGGQDHTSVINGLARAHNLIYTGDLTFVRKYEQSLQAVNLWLKSEVSVYGSTISA